MRRFIGLAVVATALFLSGCGSDDGGVPGTDTEKVETEYHDGSQGIDVQDIETYDANVQVQVVVVDGIKCVLAVRGGDSTNGMALACP